MSKPPGIEKRRWVPSDEAKSLLETIFSADSFPTFSVRTQLAQQLGIDARQVQIWFQNRRQRERLRAGKLAVPPPAGQGRVGALEAAAHVAALADHTAQAGGATVSSEGRVGGKRSFDEVSASHSSASKIESSGTISAAALMPPPPPPSHVTGAAGFSLSGAAGSSSTADLKLPATAPPALLHMLDTPGGPRALAAAARSLLLNNPILQHPGAPCHALLKQLSGMAGEQRSTPGSSLPGSFHSRAGPPHSQPLHAYQSRAQATSSNAPRQPPASSQPATGLDPLATLAGEALRRDVSSEALEVLSSQFFTGS